MIGSIKKYLKIKFTKNKNNEVSGESGVVLKNKAHKDNLFFSEDQLFGNDFSENDNENSVLDDKDD